MQPNTLLAPVSDGTDTTLSQFGIQRVLRSGKKMETQQQLSESVKGSSTIETPPFTGDTAPVTEPPSEELLDSTQQVENPIRGRLAPPPSTPADAPTRPLAPVEVPAKPPISV